MRKADSIFEAQCITEAPSVNFKNKKLNAPEVGIFMPRWHTQHTLYLQAVMITVRGIY
jgi:hypothetical protein